MKIEFAVTPPGGGGIDYSVTFETSALPITGDFIFKQENEGKALAYATFIVTRRRFFSDQAGGRVVVEVEPARSSQESIAHRRLCVKYASRGKQVQELPDSGY